METLECEYRIVILFALRTSTQQIRGWYLAMDPVKQHSGSASGGIYVPGYRLYDIRTLWDSVESLEGTWLRGEQEYRRFQQIRRRDPMYYYTHLQQQYRSSVDPQRCPRADRIKDGIMQDLVEISKQLPLHAEQPMTPLLEDILHQIVKTRATLNSYLVVERLKNQATTPDKLQGVYCLATELSRLTDTSIPVQMELESPICPTWATEWIEGLLHKKPDSPLDMYTEYYVDCINRYTVPYWRQYHNPF